MSFSSPTPAPPKFDQSSLIFQVQIDDSMGVQHVPFVGCGQGRNLGRSWCLKGHVLRARGEKEGAEKPKAGNSYFFFLCSFFSSFQDLFI